MSHFYTFNCNFPLTLLEEKILTYLIPGLCKIVVTLISLYNSYYLTFCQQLASYIVLQKLDFFGTYRVNIWNCWLDNFVQNFIRETSYCSLMSHYYLEVSTKYRCNGVMWHQESQQNIRLDAKIWSVTIENKLDALIALRK